MMHLSRLTDRFPAEQWLCRLLLLAAMALPLSATAGSEQAGPVRERACVVLLHGLWRTGLSMKAVEWGLEKAGFQVVNLSYPSLRFPVERLAVMAVEEGIRACRALGVERIDFVTHSLGGILVREYQSHSAIPGLQRVVMLGPPNQGSQLAEYVASLAFLRLFTPQAVAQLGTGEQSVPLSLGPVDFQLGIVAGTSNPWHFLPGFPAGPADGTVAVAETIVPGALDFLEMPVSHTFMMWNQAVIEQVVYFLEHGAFRR